MLMTSPLADGLFRRVISESRPAFNPAQTLSQAEALGKAGGDLAPGDPHRTPLERLRALPAADVEKLVVQAKAHIGADTSTFTMDGWVLPSSPNPAIRMLKACPTGRRGAMAKRNFSKSERTEESQHNAIFLPSSAVFPLMI